MLALEENIKTAGGGIVKAMENKIEDALKVKQSELHKEINELEANINITFKNIVNNQNNNIKFGRNDRKGPFKNDWKLDQAEKMERVIQNKIPVLETFSRTLSVFRSRRN